MSFYFSYRVSKAQNSNLTTAATSIPSTSWTKLNRKSNLFSKPMDLKCPKIRSSARWQLILWFRDTWKLIWIVLKEERVRNVRYATKAFRAKIIWNFIWKRNILKMINCKNTTWQLEKYAQLSIVTFLNVQIFRRKS